MYWNLIGLINWSFDIHSSGKRRNNNLDILPSRCLNENFKALFQKHLSFFFLFHLFQLLILLLYILKLLGPEDLHLKIVKHINVRFYWGLHIEKFRSLSIPKVWVKLVSLFFSIRDLHIIFGQDCNWLFFTCVIHSKIIAYLCMKCHELDWVCFGADPELKVVAIFILDFSLHWSGY